MPDVGEDADFTCVQKHGAAHVDTNVTSEACKGSVPNSGVRAFFLLLRRTGCAPLAAGGHGGRVAGWRGYHIQRRGDLLRARRLQAWLETVLRDYHDGILAFDLDVAQVWGRLRTPQPENGLDKQLAADRTDARSDCGDMQYRRFRAYRRALAQPLFLRRLNGGVGQGATLLPAVEPL